jgi:phage/plasmid-like protein (TIGR03299 family)
MEHLAIVGGSPFAQSTLTSTGNVEQWAKDSNLEWEIKSSELMFDVGLVDLDGKPLYQTDPKRQVLYRSDTRQRLGVVSNNFKVVQPRQILEFYRQLSESLNVNLDAAGWVKNGAVVWGLADIGKEISIKGQDRIKNYLMFSTANDGTKATTIHFISRRMVCNNMLNYAFSQVNSSPFSISIGHMTEITKEKETSIINEIVKGSGEHWGNFETTANNMADVGMGVEDAIEYFTTLLSIKDKDGILTFPKSKGSTLLKLVDVFQNGVGQNTRSAQNTLWGAVNAVSRFTDHEVKYRSPQNAIATSQFGIGNTLKNKAFTQASEILLKVA